MEPGKAKVRKRVRRRAGRSAAGLTKDRPASDDGLQEWVNRLYGDQKPEGVVDELLADRRRETDSGIA